LISKLSIDKFLLQKLHILYWGKTYLLIFLLFWCPSKNVLLYPRLLIGLIINLPHPQAHKVSVVILTIYQYAYKILLFMIERYDSEAIIKKLFNYWLHIFPN